MLDISGVWTFWLMEDESACGVTGGEPEELTVTITHNTGDKSVELSVGGDSLNGVLQGRMLAVWGRYPEDEGMTQEYLTALVYAGGTKIRGGSTWTHRKKDATRCGGTCVYRGEKN